MAREYISIYNSLTKDTIIEEGTVDLLIRFGSSCSISFDSTSQIDKTIEILEKIKQKKILKLQSAEAKWMPTEPV